MEQIIQRINELSKISKNRELTDAEKKEQSTLRKKYISSFKNNLNNILDNTYIQYSDVTRKKLNKKN